MSLPQNLVIKLLQKSHHLKLQMSGRWCNLIVVGEQDSPTTPNKGFGVKRHKEGVSKWKQR
jgi:hypothetical protein